jgi:peptidoglycan/xylan/chitin deacetylase (PgdA/CDA1 family)
MFVRNFLAPTLFKIGISSLILKVGNGKYVLCYHGVNDFPNFIINNRHVVTNQIKKDLLYYSKNFIITSLKDIFQTNNQYKHPTLAITFDDGYINNFNNIIPVINEFKLPVTFFVITKSLEEENFITWYDQIDFVKFSQPNNIQFDSLEFTKITKTLYQNNGQSIENYIKSMGYKREFALNELFSAHYNTIEKYKSEYPEYWKLVDRKTLLAHCQNPLLTIGSHTHLHFNLGNLTPDLVEMELNTSKRILENLCQYEINSIAYPDGSYNEDVKKMALQCGYTQQLAVDFKLESDWDDKHILRRYSYSNSTTHEVNMLKMGVNAKKYRNL